MLRKLFKYENKAYNKLVPLSFAIMIPLVAVARVLIEIMAKLPENVDSLLESLGTLATMFSAYVAVFACGAVASLPSIILAVSFYKKLVKDEGYLSFTLPVKNSDHLFCKTVTSIIWSLIAGVVVAAVALGAIFIGADKGFFDAIGVFFKEMLGEIGDLESAVLIVEAIVSSVVSVAFSAVCIAFSISVGQLCKKYKLLGSIGCYIGLNYAFQFISSMIGYIILIYISGVETLSAFAALQLLMTPTLVLTVIAYIVLYFISKRIITRRLNLE